jgi:hypothetical protein
MLEDQKVEAQQVLNELFSQHRIPFKLTAQRVESVGVHDYIVLFQDSRLYSVDVAWNEGEKFKDVFCESLLDLLERRSGRLRRNTAFRPKGQ